jgi:hypothetical protein
VTVERGPGLDGLSEMVADLLDQLLAREPDRAARLRHEVAVLIARDAGVAATLRMRPGCVRVERGATRDAELTVSADAGTLLGLAAAPLVRGLPDPRSAEGRGAILGLASGRIRVHGLARHPGALARLTSLLSAR